ATPMQEAFAGVKEDIKRYTEQIKLIRARIEELESDPMSASLVTDEDDGKVRIDIEQERSELRDAEHAYLRSRAHLQNKYPLNVLADAGIIPNFAFPEPGVTLSALLREPFEEGNDRVPGKRVEYQRSASQAI